MRIFKYLVEAVIIYFLFILFRICGLNIARKISSFLMKKIGFIFRKKSVVRKNILNVFKDYSDTQIKKLTDTMWENYGYILAEYIYLDRFRLNKFPKKNINLIGEEKLKNIIESKKPHIFISGHFGNFELMAMELEKRGVNLATIYRPLNNFFLNPFMLYLRKKYICKNQIKKGLRGTRDVINFAKQSFSIALMVDQRVGESERYPFFNIPAHTTTIPAQLALKFHMDIVPVHLKREEDNSFTLEILDKVQIDKTNIMEEDKKNFTIEINKIIEKMVLKNPGQWIWTHSRWK